MAPSVVGGMLRATSTLVSSDGGHLFVASGSSVRVYSTATGERLLLLLGHAADVTAICRHPKSDTQVYTASLDGTIKLWDYSEGTVQQTWVVGEEIEAMVLPSKQVAVLSCRWRAGAAGRIVTYSFVQKKRLERTVKLSAPGPLVASPNGAYVATLDRNSLIVLCVREPHSTPITLHHTKTLTCLAIDSTSTHVAAGDAKGRILIWSGLSDAAAASQSGAPLDARTAGMTFSTIQWHAHAVGALAFSPDGLYLLSGGREAVLVIWQLETLKRTYLPRLGGPISHIAACVHDVAKYAVCQESNAVRMVSLSTMTVDCSMYGVRPPPLGATAEAGTAPTTCQPGSGYLVMPCVGAQLQFYDVSKDRHIARLAVVPRNLISSTDEEETQTAGVLREPAVAHTSFSHDATVMVTVEVRPDSGSADASWTIKFWDADVAAMGPAAYAAHTVIHDPHGGPVTGVAFHPSDFTAVSTGVSQHGGAGEFRVWVRQAHKKAPGSLEPAWHWRCRSVGSYKGLPMGCCTFTADGSLLAVAAGPHITLWQPSSSELMAVLPAPACCDNSPLTRLHFATGAPYIIAACAGPKPHLMAWNLLSLTLWWAVAVPVIDVAADPRCPRVTVVMGTDAGEACTIVEMAVEEPKVLRSWSCHDGRVCKVLYPPSRSALYSRALGASRDGDAVPALAITEDRRMMLLPTLSGAESTSFVEEGALSAPSAREARAAKGGYAAMFGAEPAAAVSSGDRADLSHARPRLLGDALAPLFDAPSHLLPSATVLCGQMLQLMLTSKSSKLPDRL